MLAECDVAYRQSDRQTGGRTHGQVYRNTTSACTDCYATALYKWRNIVKTITRHALNRLGLR